MNSKLERLENDVRELKALLIREEPAQNLPHCSICKKPITTEIWSEDGFSLKCSCSAVTLIQKASKPTPEPKEALKICPDCKEAPATITLYTCRGVYEKCGTCIKAHYVEDMPLPKQQRRK